MKRPLFFAIATIAILSFTISELAARGRGGGGAMRGGGRSMPYGNFGGGGVRTPSMSRPQSRPATRPQPARPNFGGAGTRPNISRPNLSRPNNNRPNASRPNANLPNVNQPIGSRPNLDRPNIGGNRPDFNRPDFNRPGTGNNRPNNDRLGAGVSSPGLSGRPSPGDLGSFLNLPGGLDRPTTLPGQVGRSNLGNRPGAGNLPNMGNRPDFSNRPNLGDRPNVGNRPNVNIGDNNQVNLNRQRNVNSIRNHWSNVGQRPFDRDWWGRHPSTLPGWHWHGGWGRYPRNWCWRHGSWARFGTWFAWSWSTPVVYDYGSNVVYRDNYVYVDDQQVASSAQYYEQASTIVESVPKGIDDKQIEWMPLGVFAIAEEGGIDNGMLIQLAISKEGIIAGTFYNDATDSGRPLEGQVDRETQRAAWKFSDGRNPDLIMETAIYNLTQDESTALVHFGDDQTQTWLMVRLPEDK